MGVRSVSSLTESQRATFNRLKAGIRGPKPSRIPRRIPPHPRPQGNSQAVLNQQTQDHKIECSRKTTKNNLPNTLESQASRKINSKTSPTAPTECKRHVWTETQNTDAERNDCLNSDTSESLVLRYPETQAAQLSRDEILEREETEVNLSRRNDGVPENDSISESYVQKPDRSVFRAEEGQVLTSRRRKSKRRKKRLSEPLAECENSSSQHGTVPQQRHQCTITMTAQGTVDQAMQRSTVHSLDTETHREVDAISYSELHNHLQLPTQHKRQRVCTP